jgi:DNA (cytosine-5)-methyltransferase 1
MLTLQGGKAIRFVTVRLAQLGYRWAYRTIDARAFGLPQRRRRVFVLAGRTHNPAAVLFSTSNVPISPAARRDTPHGFYWTEGSRGTGWAVDAIPPLKSSSGVGIICPPAIWLPRRGSIVTPTIQDAEALQGLPRGWTSPAAVLDNGERGRWRLVANAVPAPMAEWIGRQLSVTRDLKISSAKIRKSGSWPSAALGNAAARYEVFTSEWPVCRRSRGVEKFLSKTAPELSARATRGFYRRLMGSGLRVPQRFKHDLARHYTRLESSNENRSANKRTNGTNERARQRP